MADQGTESKGLLIESSDLVDWDESGSIIPTQAQLDEDQQKAEGKTDPVPAPVVDDDDEQDTNTEWVADPGEFTPADYSFEVTTYDEKGEKPKTHKITSTDDWDKLMEDEPNFGSGAALTKAMRLATKMDTNTERDLADWKKQKADYETVVGADKQQAEQLGTWVSEMDYLVTRGDLPKIAKEYVDADWSDAEVAKQDGVKEQIELMNFMKRENKARTKANLKPITSMIDAFNAFQADKSRKGEPTKPDAGTVRKAAGARVASGSANPVGTAPKGIAVGRGGSLDDLGASWF